MAKVRTLKAYLLGCDDDAEVVLTSAAEHTDHVDGDFLAMDTVIAALEDVEHEAGVR